MARRRSCGSRSLALISATLSPRSRGYSTVPRIGLLARVTEQSVRAHNFRVARHTAKSAFVSQSAHSVPQPDHWLFKRKLSTLNSRQALISEQDARSVNQILFIAKLFNQFVGKQRDFALQIRGQLAIDFSARVRR